MPAGGTTTGSSVVEAVKIHLLSWRQLFGIVAALRDQGSDSDHGTYALVYKVLERLVGYPDPKFARSHGVPFPQTPVKKTIQRGRAIEKHLLNE